MQRKISSLFSVLILLTAVCTLTGCRTNGAPFYKVSAWEFYNPFSSKKDDKKIDDFALANDIEESRASLPKAEVSVPRDGYLNGNPSTKETRLAKDAPKSTRVNIENDALKNNSSQSLADNRTTQKNDSLGTPSNSSNMMASNNTVPQYGTVTPIGNSMNNPSYAMGQPQNSGAMMNPQMNGMNSDPNAAMMANMNNGQNYGAANYNNFGNQNQIPAYTPAAANTPNNMNNALAQNQMPAASGYPQSTTLYDPNQPLPNTGMPSAASPNSIAANAGTGYVGDLSVNNNLPNNNNLQSNNNLNGGYNPSAAAPQGTANAGQSYYPNTANTAPGTATPNVVVPNMTIPGNGNYTAPNNGNYTAPTSTSDNPNAMTIPVSGYQPAQNSTPVYNTGFQSFAPTTDDNYRPGGY